MALETIKANLSNSDGVSLRYTGAALAGGSGLVLLLSQIWPVLVQYLPASITSAPWYGLAAIIIGYIIKGYTSSDTPPSA